MVIKTYQFTMPCDYDEAFEAIRQVSSELGKVKRCDNRTGEIAFKLNAGAYYPVKYHAVVWNKNGEVGARIVARSGGIIDVPHTRTYASFLARLGLIISLPVSPAAPYVVSTLPMSSHASFQTITTGGLGRGIVGGILFGGVGAIVGGVTGKRKSVTTEIPSTQAIFLVIYSNGEIREETVKKNSNLYNEYMAKQAA